MDDKAIPANVSIDGVWITGMLRATLAAYMLLLSLTGPNPCCCTLARFAVMSTAWARKGDTWSTQRRGCCGRQLVYGFAKALGQFQSESRLPISNGPSSCCPCNKNLCHAIPSQSIALLHDLAPSGLDELILDLACPHSFALTPVVVEAHRSDQPPRLARSGREIRIDICSWHC